MSDKYAGACWNELMANESKDSLAELYMDTLASLRAKDAEIERLTKINRGICDISNDYIQANAKLDAENASLKAQVERLSAPLSDEEWYTLEPIRLPEDHSQLRTWLDAIIASRAAKEKQ